MRRKMYGVEEAIGLIANKLSMPELKDLMEERDGETCSSTDRDSSRQAMASASIPSSLAPPTWEVVMDPKSGPATIPASCVSTVPHIRTPGLLPTGDRSHLDLITSGVVSLENAEVFFALYSQRLDSFLYRILIDHDSLSSVRASSPLLTAAVCAVGALHKSSTEFDACYEEFITLSAAQVFSKKNTADDVRALCIGAFWLSDVSWTLVGLGEHLAILSLVHLRCADSCASGTYRYRDRTPSMYKQDASREKGVLPAHSSMVPRICLRSSLLHRLWQASNDA